MRSFVDRGKAFRTSSLDIQSWPRWSLAFRSPLLKHQASLPNVFTNLQWIPAALWLLMDQKLDHWVLRVHFLWLSRSEVSRGPEYILAICCLLAACFYFTNIRINDNHGSYYIGIRFQYASQARYHNKSQMIRFNGNIIFEMPCTIKQN